MISLFFLRFEKSNTETEEYNKLLCGKALRSKNFPVKPVFS